MVHVADTCFSVAVPACSKINTVNELDQKQHAKQDQAASAGYSVVHRFRV